VLVKLPAQCAKVFLPNPRELWQFAAQFESGVQRGSRRCGLDDSFERDPKIIALQSIGSQGVNRSARFG